LGTNTNFSLLSFLGKTTIGVDMRNESISSTVLGYSTGDSVPVPGTNSAYYKKFHSRNNTGLFVEHSYHTDKFSVSAGGIFNFNTDQGLKGKFYPGVDISYKFYKNYRIYASVNSAVRMPTFTDLFYVGPENIGNSNLKPEESVTYEGGIKTISAIFNGNASFFFRQGKNIIDWNKQSIEDTLWMPSNITELNTTGIELQGSVNTSLFAINPVYGVRSVHIGMLFMDITKSTNNTISRYALDYLSSKITAGVDLRLYKNIYTNWQFVYQNRNGDYQVYNSETGGYDTKSYEPFTIIDAKLYLEHKIFNPYIEVSNIFNVDYNDIGGVPQSGRWIRGGIKVNLVFN
jgi:iron complex outermembrane receptor protein